MNLYEIELEILKCFNEETGEVLNDELLTSLEIQKKEKIENICLWIKNLEHENIALKTEIDKFTEKKKRNENKIKNLTQYIDNILQGQKFNSTRVDVTYRQSKSVEVDNNFIEWAKQNTPDLLSYKEPTPDKTKIKKIIESGTDLEHAKIVTNNNIKIK